MRNTSEMGKPPIPDTWGSENASPTKSYELIPDESIMFQPKYIPNHDELQCCSKDYSPTTEFLQMTERLIKSKALSSRESKALKNLYVHYKSIKGYGPTEIIHIQKNKNTTTKKSSPASKKFYSHSRRETPSTSKEITSSTESSDSEEVDKKSIRETRKILDEVERHQIQLLTVEDFNSEHTCDSEIFIIQNTFSDFSLKDVGLEAQLKKKIKKWTMKLKKKRRWFQSSSEENRQDNIPVENQSDQRVEQAIETRREGRLKSIWRRMTTEKREDTPEE